MKGMKATPPHPVLKPTRCAGARPQATRAVGVWGRGALGCAPGPRLPQPGLEAHTRSVRWISIIHFIPVKNYFFRLNLLQIYEFFTRR